MDLFGTPFHQKTRPTSKTIALLRNQLVSPSRRRREGRKTSIQRVFRGGHRGSGNRGNNERPSIVSQATGAWFETLDEFRYEGKKPRSPAWRTSFFCESSRRYHHCCRATRRRQCHVVATNCLLDWHQIFLGRRLVTMFVQVSTQFIRIRGRSRVASATSHHGNKQKQSCRKSCQSAHRKHLILRIGFTKKASVSKRSKRKPDNSLSID